MNDTLVNDSVPVVYWPDFGGLQYLEVVYMTIITVLGTVGNLIVIFSIALEKRIHLHGNAFIINLAVADFLVSALVNPTVVANIVVGGNAVGEIYCDFIGYVVTSTCTCSLYNLMFIAFNRYWAVVRSSSYHKVFTRQRVYLMIAFTWAMSIILVCPTVLGWGKLTFDAKILVCLWDDTADYGYTWFITTLAVIIPTGIIFFCYWRLFKTVRGSGRWVRSLSVGSGISQNSDQHRRSVRKERSLLKTLITTVVLFLICWVPFAACVLINPGHTPAHIKKVAGWLALTNSCVNFIVYGAMNPVFRRGYRNLFIFLFRCKRAQHISSAALHGSFSDSYRSQRRGTKGKLVDNGIAGNLSFDNNKENSRIDSVGGIPPAASLSSQMTPLGSSPFFGRAVITSQHINTPSPLVKRSRSVTFNESEKVSMLATLPSSMNQKIERGNEQPSDDDDFRQAHAERYSRRSQSEACKQMNKNQNNMTDQNGIMLHVKDLSQDCLRRSWLPGKAVYTSKQTTPLNGSATGTPNGTPKISPTRQINVATVSNGVAMKSSQINSHTPSAEAQDTSVKIPAIEVKSEPVEDDEEENVKNFEPDDFSLSIKDEKSLSLTEIQLYIESELSNSIMEDLKSTEDES